MSHYFHIRLPIFDPACRLNTILFLSISDGRELSLVGYIRETIARNRSHDVRETRAIFEFPTCKKDKVARFVIYEESYSLSRSCRRLWYSRENVASKLSPEEYRCMSDDTMTPFQSFICLNR